MSIPAPANLKQVIDPTKTAGLYDATCREGAANGARMMSAFAAIDSATHAFSPTAQGGARFLRSIGVGANNDTVLLLATLDRRFPGLSLHDLHEATVLVEALTLETRGNA